MKFHQVTHFSAGMKLLIFFGACLIAWIHGCTALQTNSEPSFKIIPLGHNSLLVKWKLSTNKAKGFTHYVFGVTKLSGGVTEINRVSAVNGHVTSYILALKTNTKYKINVEITGTYFEEPFRTVLEAQTNQIENAAPFKPDFDYQIMAENYAYPEVKITWLPCGKRDDCGNEFAGAYFYVKYEELGSDNPILVEEYVNDYVYINDCRPGHKYRFVVVSLYRDYETESDPKEIYFPNGPSNFATMEAIAGENITISCKLPTPSWEPITWNWTSSFLNPEKVTLWQNGDLHIKELELFDGGKYSCYTETSSSALIAVTFLHVRARTQITNERKFKNVVVKSGDNFQMECDYWHDRSLNVGVKWLKNGKLLVSDENTEIVEKRRSVVRISHATKENSGDYTCLVTTSLDSTHSTFNLNVI